MFGLYVNHHSGRKLQLHCSLWVYIFSSGHIPICDVINNRWKSPAVWDMTRRTSLRVWTELQQFSPLSDSLLVVSETITLTGVLKKKFWHYLTPISCLKQSPPIRECCSSASSPSALFLHWPRGRFSIWDNSSRPRSWLSEYILRDLRDTEGLQVWKHLQGHCNVPFTVFLIMLHISSVFEIFVFIIFPNHVFCALYGLSIKLVLGFFDNILNFFIFQNPVFFYCAVKGISITLVLACLCWEELFLYFSVSSFVYLPN